MKYYQLAAEEDHDQARVKLDLLRSEKKQHEFVSVFWYSIGAQVGQEVSRSCSSGNFSL